MRLQVITFGHALSDVTKAYLFKLDPQCKIFSLPLHISQFHKSFEEMNTWMTRLRELGCDFSNRTQTCFVPPGSSTACAVFMAAWAGKTGDLPMILNLIRRGDNFFAPSPEAPILDLVAYEDHKLAMNENPELISLQSMKSSIRQTQRSGLIGAEGRVETLENFQPRARRVMTPVKKPGPTKVYKEFGGFGPLPGEELEVSPEEALNPPPSTQTYIDKGLTPTERASLKTW